MSHTYVLYNNCFGGFSFKYEFMLELFQRFPPHTPEGQELFEEYEPHGCMDKTTEPFFDDYHFMLDTYRDEYENYKPKHIKNITNNKAYYIDGHIEEHRANPNIIRFLFERAEKLTEEEFNEQYESFLRRETYVQHMDLLIDSDGNKKYNFNNW